MSSQPSALSLQQIPQILLGPGEMLPEHVLRQIVALGPEAITPLQAILDDEDLLDEDSTAGGWAPIRAARLLGELRGASAIPRLLELAKEGPDAIITSEAAHALERIGEAALEPVLEAANRTEDDFYRGLLSEVLAVSPRKDDRIFELLLRVLPEAPDVGIGSLAKYGDKRAIPVLLRLLQAYEPDPQVSLFADQTIIELKVALEELEAELTPPQSALLEQHYQEMKRKRDLARALGAQAAARQAPVKREGTKVGRNDPCPCGSGKKFKKCCGG